MKAYFKSTLLHRVSRRFSQYVALHLHACQLSAQPADFHLLGAHRRFTVRALELALALRLHPVEQRLLHDPQRSGGRCNALPTLDQPDRLLLEFERVARP